MSIRYLPSIVSNSVPVDNLGLGIGSELAIVGFFFLMFYPEILTTNTNPEYRIEPSLVLTKLEQQYWRCTALLCLGSLFNINNLTRFKQNN